MEKKVFDGGRPKGAEFEGRRVEWSTLSGEKPYGRTNDHLARSVRGKIRVLDLTH
jgi:hypothetical protein